MNGIDLNPLPRNPWLSLRDRPYVHQEDALAIAAFNAGRRGTVHEIMTDVMPEPFIGSPQAPVWLLSLNPGFEESDLLHGPNVIKAQKISASLKAQHFWYIDPTYHQTGGFRWWTKNMKAMIEVYGWQKVADTFFCVELFPYHSQKYKYCGRLLPSQQFTRVLVSQACRARKLFLIMRGRRRWIELVPSLGAATVVELRNKRNPWIAYNNMSSSGGVREILEK